MVNKLFLTVILIFSSCVYAQQSDDKAILTDISGSYSGSWKSDMTHGKGMYTRADGTSHEGRWINSNSMRKRHMPPYKITNSLYVSRSTIKRAINQANEVRIRVMQNGHENTDIEDFSLAYDSGNEYRVSNIYGIQNTSLPLYLKVTYRSWNVFHAVQNDVSFEVTIFAPGTWDITLLN